MDIEAIQSWYLTHIQQVAEYLQLRVQFGLIPIPNTLNYIMINVYLLATFAANLI